MTDQNNTTTVETSQTNPKASLEQWQHLPIYTIRDRVKPLAVLRYGDTTVRLGWPIVDFILLAQYSPTRHTEDGISPALIVEETEMTYTAEPTAVPEPQREVWEILAKSPSYEMRKIAAGRGLKVETFIKLLNDRAFCVREAVLDNIDGLETLASTEDGRRAVADALKDRTLRNTVRHRIRYIDEHAAAVLRPLLIKAVTEGDAVAGDAIPFELVLNPDTDPYTITLTEPAAIENAIDSLMSYDDFDDTEGHNGPDLFDLTAQPEYVIEKFASDPREFVRQYAAHYVRSSMPAARKLAFDESPAVRRAVCVEPKDLTNEERIAFYGDDPERLIDYVENLQELPATTDFIRLLLADPDPAVVQHTTRQIQDLIVEAVNDAEDFEDEDEEDEVDEFGLDGDGLDPDWDIDFRDLYGDDEEDDEDDDEDEDEDEVSREKSDARNLKLPLFDEKQ